MIQSSPARRRTARTRLGALLALAAVTLAPCAGAVTDAERASVYHEFRALFDSHRYQEALPLAEQLVTLTEQQYGASDRALVNPLTNLATVAYRLKDWPNAEKSYARSVEILGASAGSTDRQLLRPLHGLGSTYMAQSDYERAIVPLEQAVDISRNLDGLFNAEQLEYLDPLIVAYVALDRRTDAEKEQQYALRVAESAFGKDAVQMLSPLGRYARWLEDTGRYATARGLHARALGIAEKSGGAGSLETVPPLVGIARTYQLEFLNGSEQPTEESNNDTFGMGNMHQQDPSGTPRMNPDGERALRQALGTIGRAKPLDHKLVGQTLVSLGDWYLIGGGAPKSQDIYRAAWKELATANATDMLQSPQQISYKGPASSIRRSSLDPQTADRRYVDVSLTVSREGQVKNIAVTGSDAPEALQHAVETAVKKARYRPKFEQGEPVETTGVTLREQLLLKPKKEAAPK